MNDLGPGDPGKLECVVCRTLPKSERPCELCESRARKPLIPADSRNPCPGCHTFCGPGVCKEYFTADIYERSKELTRRQK